VYVFPKLCPLKGSVLLVPDESCTLQVDPETGSTFYVHDEKRVVQWEYPEGTHMTQLHPQKRVQMKNVLRGLHLLIQYLGPSYVSNCTYHLNLYGLQQVPP